MRKILKVKTLDFVLECEMENGDVYSYDMSFVLQETGEMLMPLKDLDFFKQVFIELGSLSWPNGYEIHANSIARDGVLISEKAS